jgi:hypothetical protein
MANPFDILPQNLFNLLGTRGENSLQKHYMAILLRICNLGEFNRYGLARDVVLNEIIDYLKEYLLKDSSNQKTKQALDAFSNNYTSVSANSGDVLFEKAFFTPKTRMSDVKETLNEIAPTKKIISWLPYLLGFIGLALFAYFYLNISNNSWNVKTGEGIFILNGNRNQIAELVDGANISTTGNSQVEIVSLLV